MTKNDPLINIELTTSQQQCWEFASSRWDCGLNFLPSFLMYSKLAVGEQPTCVFFGLCSVNFLKIWMTLDKHVCLQFATACVPSCLASLAVPHFLLPVGMSTLLQKPRAHVYFQVITAFSPSVLGVLCAGMPSVLSSQCAVTEGLCHWEEICFFSLSHGSDWNGHSSLLPSSVLQKLLILSF